MISQLIKNCKYLTQSIYNSFLNTIDLSKCNCSCGAKGQFYMHGYYNRSVKVPSGKIRLSILRVKCKSCGKTHAILHPSIVPYSQTLFSDTVDIITSYHQDKPIEHILINNPELTESDVRYTIKKYLKHWKQRLLTKIEGTLEQFLKLRDFQIKVSRSFKMAFMQIKRCFYYVV